MRKIILNACCIFVIEIKIFSSRVEFLSIHETLIPRMKSVWINSNLIWVNYTCLIQDRLKYLRARNVYFLLS